VTSAYSEHNRKCGELVAELALARARGGTIRLGKPASNLFRSRRAEGVCRLDVRNFNRILNIDPERMIADVEGMTPYDALVDESLGVGLLPAVTPQLKSITVGGAVSGVGIESSSFRYGLVHETVVEMEILLGDGSIVTCSKTENADLFFGFPNSYGTLGYALRLKIQLVPARPYVHLIHRRFTQPDTYFGWIDELCRRREMDFLDGMILSGDEMYLTEGRFTGDAPHVSDYTYRNIYYKSIAARTEDWLTASGYIWRWDTDWFWCSKQFGAQNPLVRVLATKWALNSRTYQRIMRLSQRFTSGRSRTESVIQDVDIPIQNATEFQRFLMAEIGIAPVWVCPFQARDPDATYDLYELDRITVYINFGFWDVLPATGADGYYNRKVEAKLVELRGKKGLYSSVYFSEETFWELYNGSRYHELKSKYDPGGVLPGLYEKCVSPATTQPRKNAIAMMKMPKTMR
jgi:FAD/FMN-containing dehydrogenase